MALNGLRTGLRWRDMRHMKYTHLMQVLLEWDDMHGEKEEEKETVREATQADLNALANL